MDFSHDYIQTFVKEHYNLHVGRTKVLAGYIDKNVLITTDTDDQFILKFSVSDPEYFLAAQNEVLQILSSNSTLYPSVIPSISGANIIHYQTYAVRLLSYLNGTFLNDVIHRSDDLLADFGQSLATLDNHLLSITIPHLSHMHLTWDIRHTLDRQQDLDLVDSPEKRRVLHYFFKQFEEQVLPVLPSLRKSIIHNDANPLNVLCKDQRICGYIDFGDMVHSCLIFDPAIALTYLMMEQEDPLRVASIFLASYHKRLPLERHELGILYYIIAARLCTSQVMAAKSRADNPDNDYISIDEDRGMDLLHKWLSINPMRAKHTFLSACGFEIPRTRTVHERLDLRNQFISKGQSVSYTSPISMESAALQYMYDDQGNSYIDCVNNIMHVGHCHPHVVTAAQRQLAKLNTNTRYLYDSLTTYAERLLNKLPSNLDKLFFVNSGSAATDLAIRLARTYTKRDEFIVIDQGYHGNTQIGIDVSSYKFDSKGGEGARSHIHKLAMPDTYRYSKSGAQYAEQVNGIVDLGQIAGFIGESILSCGGQLVLPDGYFEHIYEKIRTAGGVCIADEVQVGFGRVGEQFWGFELQGVEPDIVIMGKPIGNGHPLAAVATTTPIAESFDNGMEFFSSFGGNPVSCEIGMAVLDVIEDEGLQAHAKELGRYILGQWRTLQQQYDCIGDVRGVGLFLGIEFVKSRTTKEPDGELAESIVNEMKALHFLLSTDGPYHNVIKFKPPMVFGYKEADLLYSALSTVLANLG